MRESTCRHCQRRIVLDRTEGWIDPEAGYDDENGDGIWRTTCDSHDTFTAEHEPWRDDPEPSTIRVHVPDGTTGTVCGLVFAGNDWDSDVDAVIADRAEAGEVTCDECRTLAGMVIP